MQLDRLLVREIKKAVNGDGSPEARLAFRETARKAASEMSTPEIMSRFSEFLDKYGKGTVAVCLAATIDARRDRLLDWAVQWADEVLKLWTNRNCSLIDLCIMDGLHPSRIEQYAGSLIRRTTEE